MTPSRGRKQKRSHRGLRVSRGEDVNPMNYLTNLADAMLVLAVGIMVALVLHWNVQLQSAEMRDDANQTDSFKQDEMSSADKVPDNAAPAGRVYYDEESDTYYFVRESDQDTVNGNN